MMRRNLTLTIVLAAVTLASSGAALAADQFKQRFDLPAQFAAVVETTACTTSPGPQVSLGGEMTFSGVTVDVIFSHLNDASNPQETVEIARSVVPPDAPMSVTEQAIVGALGDNPYIWLQLTDPTGRPLTSEIFLGRCDQGLFSPTIDYLIPAEAVADVSATECEAPTGPVVGLEGEVQLTPINAKLIFRDSDAMNGPRARSA